MFSVMSSATSSRTGEPNRRRASSRSSACSRSSSRSSSTSKSALRVTRNAWCSTISMPGNSTGRSAAISSSIGRKRTTAPSRLSSSTNRSTLSGTLTRAKCSTAVSGCLTVTARFRLSPLTNGNGCAGSTASGVSTGNTCSWKYVDSRPRSVVVELGPRDDQDALLGQRRAHRVEEHLRVPLAICWVRSLMRRSCSRGDRPSAERTDRPISSRRFRPGDPDHVELVEVGGEDRQELRPLQQRQ